MKNELYEMELHEQKQIQNFMILRVAGGWIYVYLNSDNGEAICSVYVPAEKSINIIPGKLETLTAEKKLYSVADSPIGESAARIECQNCKTSNIDPLTNYCPACGRKFV